MSNIFILDETEIKMIDLLNGQRLLLVDGYSFHKHSQGSSEAIRWRCSSYKKACPAFIVMTNGNTCIARCCLTHKNHEVPLFDNLRNGKWVRLYF